MLYLEGQVECGDCGVSRESHQDLPAMLTINDTISPRSGAADDQEDSVRPPIDQDEVSKFPNPLLTDWPDARPWFHVTYLDLLMCRFHAPRKACVDGLLLVVVFGSHDGKSRSWRV